MPRKQLCLQAEAPVGSFPSLSIPAQVNVTVSGTFVPAFGLTERLVHSGAVLGGFVGVGGPVGGAVGGKVAVGVAWNTEKVN